MLSIAAGSFRFRQLTAVLFALIISLSAAKAQEVAVRVPDTTATVGDALSVPVFVSGLDNAEDVTAYGFELGYSSNPVVTYRGIDTTETLSASAGFTVQDNPDIPRVGAFGGTPLSAQASEGVLIRIRLQVQSADSTTVSLQGFQLNDGSPPADPRRPTFKVRGREANFAPRASAEEYELLKNDTLRVDHSNEGVLSNDADPNGDSLQASVVGDVSRGTLTLNGDGTFEYVPEEDFVGGDAFTYRVSDGRGAADTAQAKLKVRPPNSSPTISDIEDQTVPEDSTTGTVPFKVQDIETPPESLKVSATSTDTTLVSEEGTILGGQDSSRTLEIVPSPDAFGTASVVVSADDGRAVTQDTVGLRVTPVNDIPVVSSDRYLATENQTLRVSKRSEGVLGNDRDVESDTLSARLVDGVSNGMLTLDQDGTLEYDPKNGFTGTDSLSYAALDGDGGSDTTSTTIRVRSNEDVQVEAAPDSVVVGDTAEVQVRVRGLKESADITAYSFDLSFDEEKLRYGGIETDGTLSGKAGFTVQANPDSLRIGAFGARPLSEVSSDGVLLQVNFRVLVEDTAEIVLGDLQFNKGLPAANPEAPSATVQGVVPNQPPRLSSDRYTTTEGRALNVTSVSQGVLGNDGDPDRDSLSVALTDSVSHGSLLFRENGTFQYTPSEGFLGTDQFGYKASDGNGHTDSTTAQILVAKDTAVAVRVEDASTALNDTVAVPVRVGNLDQAPDVTSFGFDLVFDSTRITYAGFSTENSLAEQAGFTVDDNPSIPRIGGFGSTPLGAEAEKGTLLSLEFVISAPGSTTVAVDSIMFNAGSPRPKPQTPSFTIVTEESFITETVEVASGWNLVSVPLVAPDQTFGALLPPCESGFSYRPGQGYRGFESDEETRPGRGFWANCVAGTSEIVGRPEEDTVEVEAGWNIIGPGADTVDVESITSDPRGIILSSFFGFDPAGGYQSAEVLVPGRGYWLRVSERGALDLSDSSGGAALVMKTRAGSPARSDREDRPGIQFRLTDATGQEATLHLTQNLTEKQRQRQTLPPRPPSGVFDVRFEGGQSVVETSGGAMRRVETQGLKAPVTVELVGAKEGQGARLRQGGKQMRLWAKEPSVELSSTGDLEIGLELKPQEFALGKPYPNPAGGQATIGYGLPKETEVTITVYDVLGRRVRILAAREAKVGRHTAVLETGQLSSGTYFVQMRAEEFEQTRRLTVVR